MVNEKAVYSCYKAYESSAQERPENTRLFDVGERRPYDRSAARRQFALKAVADKFRIPISEVKRIVKSRQMGS